MARKAKATQGSRSLRGLGYLTVICLVVAALVVGAANEPIKELLGISTNSGVAPVDNPPGTENVLAPNQPALNNPQQIESIIMSDTELAILKVTVADNTRIEYVLEPASIGVDASHRRAVIALTCALRSAGAIRRPVVFVGVSRYVDSAGNPALRSRMQSKLTALWLNRMNCAADISDRDIDWRRITEYEIRFAIPPGFKIDL